MYNKYICISGAFNRFGSKYVEETNHNREIKSTISRCVKGGNT